MKKEATRFFIGIDLGGTRKATTGICLLETSSLNIYLPSKNQKLFLLATPKIRNCYTVRYTEIFKIIRPFLKKTEVIAVDGPLTLGKGKGLMRLFEKFLSTKIFREEHANPLPPALMPELSLLGQDLTLRLEKFGFIINKNLIETFPTLVDKMLNNDVLEVLDSNKKQFKNEHEKSAYICALVGYLHFYFKTRWLGYKDGFLFLPERNFWKEEWRQKFYSAWISRSKLKYKYLITNIFNC